MLPILILPIDHFVYNGIVAFNEGSVPIEALTNTSTTDRQDRINSCSDAQYIMIKKNKYGPKFLCIGAPKTGTTWLHKNLSKHPEVWLPPIKEVRYFDRFYGVPSGPHSINERKGLFGIYNDYPSELIIKAFAKSLVNLSVKDGLWLLRYFVDFKKHADDDWYKGLFPDSSQITCGEITPAYCALESNAVKKIHRTFPFLNIIFIMRNPVDRAWSNAKMMLPRMLGKPVEDISNEMFIDYILNPGVGVRGDYVRTIRNWEEYYDKENIYYVFYDDIVSCPHDVILDVCGFIGVSAPNEGLLNDVGSKVNESKGIRGKSIPVEIEEVLKKYYLQDVKWLSDKFKSRPLEWYDYIKKM